MSVNLRLLLVDLVSNATDVCRGWECFEGFLKVFEDFWVFKNESVIMLKKIKKF